MVLDVSALPDDEDPDQPVDELTVDIDQPRRKNGLGQLHISHLLQMVLQDAQTRLTFKAQSVIQSDIRYYAPKQEDLAYPDILICVWCPFQEEELILRVLLSFVLGV
jgi:conserved oligomeric Golgi complex subunit 3